MDFETEAQNKIERTQEKIERDNELNDLRQFLRSKSGRGVLVRILERSGAFKLSMQADDRMTIFCEGQREIGLWLLGELKAVCGAEKDKDLEAFNEMITEYWSK